MQERLDQLLAEAERLRRALAALDPRAGASPPTRTVAPRPPRRRPAANRPRGNQGAPKGRRSAPGETKARVLSALSDKAMTAGDVASATGLPPATVSTTLSRRAKSGDVLKAERGYCIPPSRR
jgi:CRP-like cAMP-binding protein